MKEKNVEPSPKKGKGQLIFFSKYNLITLTAFKNAATIDQMFICKVTFGQKCLDYILVLEKFHILQAHNDKIMKNYSSQKNEMTTMKENMAFALHQIRPKAN